MQLEKILARLILWRLYSMNSNIQFFKVPFSKFLEGGGVEDEGIAIGKSNATLNTAASKLFTNK